MALTLMPLRRRRALASLIAGFALLLPAATAAPAQADSTPTFHPSPKDTTPPGGSPPGTIGGGGGSKGGNNGGGNCNSQNALVLNGVVASYPNWPNCLQLNLGPQLAGYAKCPTGELVFRFYGTLAGGKPSAESVSFMRYTDHNTLTDPVLTCSAPSNNILFYPSSDDYAGYHGNGGSPFQVATGKDIRGLPSTMAYGGSNTSNAPVRVVGNCYADWTQELAYKRLNDPTVPAAYKATLKSELVGFYTSHLRLGAPIAATYANLAGAYKSGNTWQISYPSKRQCFSPWNYTSVDSAPLNQQRVVGTCYVPLDVPAIGYRENGRDTIVYGTTLGWHEAINPPASSTATADDTAHPYHSQWRADAATLAAQLPASMRPYQAYPKTVTQPMKTRGYNQAQMMAQVRSSITCIDAPREVLPKSTGPTSDPTPSPSPSSPTPNPTSPTPVITMTPNGSHDVILPVTAPEVFQVGGKTTPGVVSVGQAIAPAGTTVVSLSYKLQLSGAGSPPMKLCTTENATGCDFYISSPQQVTPTIQLPSSVQALFYNASNTGQQIRISVLGVQAKVREANGQVHTANVILQSTDPNVSFAQSGNNWTDDLAVVGANVASIP